MTIIVTAAVIAFAMVWAVIWISTIFIKAFEYVTNVIFGV